MADEFTIKPETGKTVRVFFYSQLFRKPPYPDHSFADQTIIVTGANVGLGFEAARHFYRLNCAKLILAVRTVSKGQAAKEDIVRTVKHRTDGAQAIEVWPLDLSSTASTLAFADRVGADLPRVDAIVENAGISTQVWSTVEGYESTIQVNVINTLLLALAVLPKLTETKRKFPGSSPHLEIVSSEVHRFTNFKEANAPDIYAKLNEEKAFTADRYPISKLLEVLFVRELVARLRAQTPSDALSPVTITLVNPGLCKSSLMREAGGLNLAVMFVANFLLARSTEVGARTLVHGACAGPESHGEFMSDGENQEVEKWIYSETGKKVQAKVFEQTLKVLESRKKGISQGIGLTI